MSVYLVSYVLVPFYPSIYRTGLLCILITSSTPNNNADTNEG